MALRLDSDSPEKAADAACLLGDAAAVARSQDGRALAILTATPFGNTVRRWSDIEPAIADDIVADTVRAQSRSFVCITEVSPLADDGIFDRYLGRSVEVPMHLDAEGNRQAAWWSVAPYLSVPFVPGDRLTPVVLHGAKGCSIAYFHADGRPAGVHIVTDRIFDAAELDLVRSTTAVVRNVASGWGHDDTGRPIDTQVLGLEVPYDFAAAFSEGILPLRPSTDYREAAIA